MGWQKGNFRHYYYREMRVGKKKDKVRLYSIIRLEKSDGIVAYPAL